MELIDTSFDITLENIQAYIAKISGVVRDTTPKNNERLFNRLLKESYGNKPSSVLAFVPCKVTRDEALSELDFRNYDFQLFGFFKGDNYYTNMRELLNWGIELDEVIDTIDFTHYKVVQGAMPYFVYQQLRTHTQLNWLSHSSRYTKSNHGYFMPEEVGKFYTQKEWNDEVESVSPIILTAKMRRCGVKRMEVYNRGKDMLAVRSFSVGGYTSNPNAYPHFFKQRVNDKHTQQEARRVAYNIFGLIEYV